MEVPFWSECSIAHHGHHRLQNMASRRPIVTEGRPLMPVPTAAIRVLRRFGFPFLEADPNFTLKDNRPICDGHHLFSCGPRVDCLPSTVRYLGSWNGLRRCQQF